MNWLIVAAIFLAGVGLWYWRTKQSQTGPQAAIAVASGWTYHSQSQVGEMGKRVRMHYYSGVIGQGASWHAHTQPLSDKDGGTEATLWKCADAKSPRKAMAIGPTDTPPRPSVLGIGNQEDGLSAFVRRVLDRNPATMPPKASMGELPWDQAYTMVSDDPFLPFQVVSPYARREMMGDIFLTCRLEVVLSSTGLLMRLEHPAGDLEALERLVHLGDLLATKILADVTPVS